MELKSDKVEAPGVLEAIELYFERRWTDGLVIVPPIEEKVIQMIEYVGRDPQEELGEIPPYRGIATIEKLAINSVMAGCLPEYFPIVVAAVEAMLAPKHNLNGTQTTQHGAEQLLIINGPIAKKLGINSGDSVFGRGFRANGTIGRAIRLVLWNLGRNFPGEADRSVYSHPGSWSYCIAENEDASPWEPLHVERGLPPGTSAVTVFCCEAPHGVVSLGTPQQILDSISDTMATTGSMNYFTVGGESETLVTISAINAEAFRKEGWSKKDVKKYIWEHARLPVGKLEKTGVIVETGARGRSWADIFWPKWIDRSDPNTLVPPTARLEDIHLVVCGGMGYHSTICPGWGFGGCAVTKEIKAK